MQFTRVIFTLIAVLGIASFAPPASAAGGPGPETMTLVNAVTGNIPWADFPKRPRMSVQLLLAVDVELQKDARVEAAYVQLAATQDNRAWFPAIEALERAKASACLTTGLWHPHPDVKIRSAQALGRLRDLRSGQCLIQVARSFAVYESGSENATLHGLFQHALADALNRIAGTAVKLKKGQDPKGLQAGLQTWIEALAQRQAECFPPPREERDRGPFGN